MTEAERLAERLEKRFEYPTQGGNSSVMWFDKDGKEWTADTGQITQLRNPDGPEAAALIRAQAEELERLRGALEKAQKPKLISTVAVLNDDGSQSFSSQGLGER